MSNYLLYHAAKTDMLRLIGDQVRWKNELVGDIKRHSIDEHYKYPEKWSRPGR